MTVKILSNDATAFIKGQRDEFSRLARSAWGQNLEAINEMIRIFERILACPDVLRRDSSVEEPSLITLTIPEENKQFIFGKRNTGITIIYLNTIFQVNGPCTIDEAKLLVRAHVKKLRNKIDVLKRGGNQTGQGYRRISVPESVRHEVWRRDMGKCVRCGSVRDLEFDHIIPFSEGGSSTARNIQLLCESCNRTKGATLG